MTFFMKPSKQTEGNDEGLKLPAESCVYTVKKYVYSDYSEKNKKFFNVSQRIKDIYEMGPSGPNPRYDEIAKMIDERKADPHFRLTVEEEIAYKRGKDIDNPEYENAKKVIEKAAPTIVIPATATTPATTVVNPKRLLYNDVHIITESKDEANPKRTKTSLRPAFHPWGWYGCMMSFNGSPSAFVNGKNFGLSLYVNNAYVNFESERHNGEHTEHLVSRRRYDDDDDDEPEEKGESNVQEEDRDVKRAKIES
jgi:hypothetical protein